MEEHTLASYKYPIKIGKLGFKTASHCGSNVWRTGGVLVTRGVVCHGHCAGGVDVSCHFAVFGEGEGLGGDLGGVGRPHWLQCGEAVRHHGSHPHTAPVRCLLPRVEAHFISLDIISKKTRCVYETGMEEHS